jgi:D-aminoacyl-tRNA deacylase
LTVLILASRTDPAAMNIAEKLVTNFGFRSQLESEGKAVFEKDDILLLEINHEILSISDSDLGYQAEAIICVSHHKSESGRPTLTAHAPGNTGCNAHHGGKARTLAWVDCRRLKSALIELSNSAVQLGLEYAVSLEATHHGPTELGTSILFVEIGSTEQQWLDPRAGEAAASAALRAATEPNKAKPAVGFGGGHYSPKHTSAVLRTDHAVGHILPEYFFNDYDPLVVKQAFEKTVGGCHTAMIDWKGLKSIARKKLISTLESSDIDLLRI